MNDENLKQIAELKAKLIELETAEAKEKEELVEHDRKVALAQVDAVKKILEIITAKELICALKDVRNARRIQLEVIKAVKALV